MGKNCELTLKTALLPCNGKMSVQEKICCCLLSSAFIFFLILFSLQVSNTSCIIWISAVCCLIMPAALMFLLSSPLKGVLFWLVPLGLSLAMVLAFYKSFTDGFAAVFNGFCDAAGSAFGKITPKLAVTNANPNLDVTLFFAVLVILLSALTVYSIKNNSIAVVLIISSAAFICEIIICPKLYSGFVLLALTTFVIIINKIGGSSCFNSKALIIKSAGFICAAVLIFAVVTVTGEKTIEPLQDLNNSINKSFDEIRYGKNEVLTDGDFTKLEGFYPDDKPILEVVMSNPQSYYLRGFVGEKYQSDGWQSIDNQRLYESSDLFFWLHHDGFFGQTQLAELKKLEQPDTSANSVIVKNIAANRKYAYLPYEVISADDGVFPFECIGDSKGCVDGFFGRESYRFTAVPSCVKNCAQMSVNLEQTVVSDNSALSKYKNDEAHYNEYVYNNYLDIPEEINNIIKTALGTYKTDKSHFDYSLAKQNILDYLSKNMTYSTEPEEYIGDFAGSFLQSTKKGYSVHFATAAVLMLRYYNIPSRYIEGYLITPQDIQGAKPNSALTLDQTHMHAWAEYYQDGVGWVPFEVTPPHLNIMDKAESITAQKSKPLNNFSNKKEDKSDKADEISANEADGAVRQKDNLSLAIYAVIFSLAVLIAITLAVLFLIKLHTKGQIKKSFANDNISYAVSNMFVYCTNLLCKSKIIDSAEEIYSAEEKLRNIFSDEYADLYVKSLALFEKARFSLHNLSESDRDELGMFVEQTKKQISNYKKRTLNKHL